ncbi:MAG: hypothetical protein J1E41_07095, partial [Ruminococcus sp.]|nr:hypothetical protein [Ruminococcus sp.]
KIVRVASGGKLQCLQTGNAKLTIKTAKGKEIKCKIKIGNMSQIFEKNLPDIKVKDKYGNTFDFDNSKGSQKNLCARVKKGKIGKFPIIGKVGEINNVYKSSKKAKIVSSPTASTLKIKGLAKGTTTVKVKINGVKTIKLKVKVI